MNLEQAIELSRSTNQIVHVELDYTDDITTVAVDAGAYADNVDCVRENDGTFDVWGWSDEMAAAESTDMEWRLKVTLPSGYKFATDSESGRIQAESFEAAKEQLDAMVDGVDGAWGWVEDQSGYRYEVTN